MRCFWLVLFFFSGLGVFGHPKYQQNYYNTDAYWQHLVLEDSSKKINIRLADTVIIIASNRLFTYDCPHFASECVDEQTLHYFIVYSHTGKWHVHQAATLAAAMVLLPDNKKDWVVYAEGMGKVFPAGVNRGMEMAAQYSVNVLYLDYPTQYTGANPLMNFIWVNNNAKNSWKYFVPVLEQFHDLATASFTGVHYTMLLHSMGNHFIRQAAKHHALTLLNKTVWMENVVLNAPCVPRANACKWLKTLTFTRHIYVHYNSYDGVLKWAKLAAHRQLLGHHPSKTCNEAVYVNFNTLCGQSHSNFLSLPDHPPLRKESRQYYNTLLHGSQVDVHDTTRFRVSVYKKLGYDLLPASNSTVAN